MRTLILGRTQSPNFALMYPPGIDSTRKLMECYHDEGRALAAGNRVDILDWSELWRRYMAGPPRKEYIAVGHSTVVPCWHRTKYGLPGALSSPYKPP